MRRIVAIAALSIGLHVAVLASLQPTTESPGTRITPPANAVTVRVLPPPNSVVVERADTSAAEPQRSRRSTPTENTSADPVPASPALAVWSTFAEGDYASADTLAQRPMPTADVIVPYPEGFMADGKVEVILALYISELGVVDRIVPEGGTEFPVLMEAALAAFRSATFSPGIAQDKRVKSKMRIAVTFDADDR